jgi:hypothetical protein
VHGLVSGEFGKMDRRKSGVRVSYVFSVSVNL